MVGSVQISSYISSVMHLNQHTGQWLISVLPLKMELLTVVLLWQSLDLPQSMGLNAAVIGVKLYNIIIHKIDLPIGKTKFWSGSMLTLQYIQDKSHCFKIYIANRVTHILESTSAADWNFIEDVRNPDAICSREVFNPNLLYKTDKYGRNWLTGPTFLHESEEHWQIESIKYLDLNDPEIRQI